MASHARRVRVAEQVVAAIDVEGPAHRLGEVLVGQDPRRQVAADPFDHRPHDIQLKPLLPPAQPSITTESQLHSPPLWQSVYLDWALGLQFLRLAAGGALVLGAVVTRGLVR